MTTGSDAGILTVLALGNFEAVFAIIGVAVCGAIACIGIVLLLYWLIVLAAVLLTMAIDDD